MCQANNLLAELSLWPYYSHFAEDITDPENRGRSRPGPNASEDFQQLDHEGLQEEVALGMLPSLRAWPERHSP